MIEYVSNPRLALLAEELQILNEFLISQKLPDSVRLFRMRDFAEASHHITGVSLPALQYTETAHGAVWNVAFRGKSLGSFGTQNEAFKAYKAAHVEHFGTDSPYRTNAPLETAHLFDLDNLPPGIEFNSDGTFNVRPFLGGRKVKVGIFKTLPEAIAALQVVISEHEKARALEEKAKKDRALEAKKAHPITECPLPTGVQRTFNRYKARITKFGKAHCIGTFGTPEEAHEAFKRAHIAHHGTKSPYATAAA